MSRKLRINKLVLSIIIIFAITIIGSTMFSSVFGDVALDGYVGERIVIDDPLSLPIDTDKGPIYCTNKGKALNTGDIFVLTSYNDVIGDIAYTYFLNDASTLQKLAWGDTTVIKKAPASLSVKPVDVTKVIVKLDGDNKIVGPYKVNIKGDKTGTIITNGFEIVNSSGQKIDIKSLSDGDLEIYFKMPKSNTSNSVSIEFDTKIYKAREYTFQYVNRADDSVLERQVLKMAKTAIPTTTKISIPFSIPTIDIPELTFQIFKIGATDSKPLAGAKFEVSFLKADGSVIATQSLETEGTSGSGSFNVPAEVVEYIVTTGNPANFKIKETAAPTGYLKKTDELTGSITGDLIPQQIYITNDKDPNGGDPGPDPTEPETEQDKSTIKITGRVWVDEPAQDKQGKKDGKYSSSDTNYKDLTVKLYKEDGTLVLTTTTKADGTYEFELKPDELVMVNNKTDYEESTSNTPKTMTKSYPNKFYVEIEYNGLKYEMVDNGFTKNLVTQEKNTNKAQEGKGNNENRTALINKYKEINASTDYSETGAMLKARTGLFTIYKKIYNKAITRKNVEYCEGNTPPSLTAPSTYTEVDRDTDGHTHYTTDSEGETVVDYYDDYVYYDITDNASWYLSKFDQPKHDYEDTTSKNLTEVNFGLFLRPLADLTLIDDVYRAEVKINGKTNVYPYNKRADAEGKGITANLTKEDLKAGANYYTQNYNRPLYTADYNYASIAPYTPDKLLEVEVTYRIAIKNQGIFVGGKLVELRYKADSKYQFKEGWYNTDGKYESNNGAIDASSGKINTNLEFLESGDVKYIFLVFKVKTSGQNLQLGIFQNEVEITKFSAIANSKTPNGSLTYTPSAMYGQIDLDSKPDNNVAKEDDQDKSPGFNLYTPGDTRTLSGNVWEDVAGNGIKNGPGVDNVIVRLFEQRNGTEYLWYEARTQGGNYEFSEYVPGDYIVRFVYGDSQQLSSNQKYNGQDYQSAIPAMAATGWKDISNWEISNFQGQSNAKDDSSRRQEVISYSTDIEYEKAIILNASPNSANGYSGSSDVSTLAQNTYMNAYTPKIVSEVEMVPNVVTPPAYSIPGIDLGLLERPKTNLVLDKTIENVSVTLANGTRLVDYRAGVEDNKYINWDNKIIFEDAEIKQGATVRITYRVTIANNSAADNLSRYELTNEIVKTSATIVDYVDPNLVFRPDEKIDLPSSTGITGDNTSYGWTNASDSLVSIKKTDSVVRPNSKAITNSKLAVATEGGQNIVLEAYLTLTRAITPLDSDDTFKFINEVEIVKFTNTAGRRDYPNIPGDFGYEIGKTQPDESQTVIVKIIPPTGDTKIFYALGIVITGILATGIIFIKKKVLK